MDQKKTASLVRQLKWIANTINEIAEWVENAHTADEIFFLYTKLMAIGEQFREVFLQVKELAKQKRNEENNFPF